MARDAGGHALSAPTGRARRWPPSCGAGPHASDPTPQDDPHTRIVYVSPLKALSYDVERNLRAPLRGITAAGATQPPTVGIRTGDTTQRERARMRRHPPDILITTPESLYLLLTSQARETLTRVEAVIVDEIHAVAATKRGSHMALTLERLDANQEDPTAGRRTRPAWCSASG